MMDEKMIGIFIERSKKFRFKKYVKPKCSIDSSIINFLGKPLDGCKICMPVSRGGHLTQALLLAEKLRKGYKISFVTSYSGKFRTKNLKWKFDYVQNPSKSDINSDIGIFNLIKMCMGALWILLKENPKVIISTGSNIPVPFFIFGKLMGKKLIYIESVSRVNSPSKSGKILHPLSDMFFVQWEELKKFYPKAIYAGRLL